MKTELWAVMFWPDTKLVGGVYLDRMTEDANYALDTGSWLRPIVILSVHSSPLAADKAAAMIGRRFRPSGWYLAERSAQIEAEDQE